ILRRGATLLVESINGTALSTSDYIGAAGNFDNKINVSGWIFDTANNALRARFSGTVSSLGIPGSHWGRAYVNGISLNGGNTAQTGTIRGSKEDTWYNRADNPGDPNIPVIGTNSDDEVVINGYLRIPLVGPTSANDVLQYDGTDYIWGPVISTGINGSGTLGTIPLFSDTNEIDNSIITQSSTTGININGYLRIGSNSLTTGMLRVDNGVVVHNGNVQSIGFGTDGSENSSSVFYLGSTATTTNMIS